jgi:hypothetical protein
VTSCPGKIIGDRADVAEQMLRRSIYEVLERDLGIVINHGVAELPPGQGGPHLSPGCWASVPGSCCSTCGRSTTPRAERPVLSSHEYHLADAFDFSVVRRGPGRRFS